MGKETKGKGAVIQWLRDRADHSSDECLIFPYCRSRSRGYGFFGYCGKTYYAHKFICELANGTAPTPLHQAAHSCGNGHLGCVNPRHLSWKTNSDNQLDRRQHGTMDRNFLGNKGGFTSEQIRTIRKLKGQKTQLQIASMFGVKRGCIEYWHSPRSLKTNPFT